MVALAALAALIATPTISHGAVAIHICQTPSRREVGRGARFAQGTPALSSGRLGLGTDLLPLLGLGFGAVNSIAIATATTATTTSSSLAGTTAISSPATPPPLHELPLPIGQLYAGPGQQVVATATTTMTAAAGGVRTRRADGRQLGVWAASRISATASPALLAQRAAPTRTVPGSGILVAVADPSSCSCCGSARVPRVVAPPGAPRPAIFADVDTANIGIAGIAGRIGDPAAVHDAGLPDDQAGHGRWRIGTGTGTAVRVSSGSRRGGGGGGGPAGPPPAVISAVGHRRYV